MESLYEIAKKLKDQLRMYDSFGVNKPISPLEINKLKRGTNNICNYIGLEFDFDFLERHDLESIANLFYLRAAQNGYDYFSVLNSELDPLLEILLDNEYEVTIHKVNINDELVDLWKNSITEYIQDLEDAYLACEKRRIINLSDNILTELFKTILREHNVKFNKNEKFPKLLDLAMRTLGLKPGEHNKNGNDRYRDFSQSLINITQNINRLRRFYSEAHSSDKEELKTIDVMSMYNFKLIVDSTKTIVNFFLYTLYESKHNPEYLSN